jgi:hypothetical protein
MFTMFAWHLTGKSLFPNMEISVFPGYLLFSKTFGERIPAPGSGHYEVHNYPLMKVDREETRMHCFFSHMDLFRLPFLGLQCTSVHLHRVKVLTLQNSEYL